MADEFPIKNVGNDDIGDWVVSDSDPPLSNTESGLDNSTSSHFPMPSPKPFIILHPEGLTVKNSFDRVLVDFPSLL